MTPSEDWIPWQVFLFRDHSCLQLPSSYKCFSVLLSSRFLYIVLLTFLMIFLTCSATAAPSLLPPPRYARACAHACTHTHTQHIHPPPWSPCGFKVLILIRFELTYLQSSFSCSSETTGSSHQDLDLGSGPCAAWSPLAARGIQMKGHLPAQPSWSVH